MPTGKWSTANQLVAERRETLPDQALRDTLLAVREFLYLLDFYAGYLSVLSYFSPDTIAVLGIESRDGEASGIRGDRRLCGGLLICLERLQNGRRTLLDTLAGCPDPGNSRLATTGPRCDVAEGVVA